MQVYLMQHGAALSDQEDPARPLSRDGVAQVQAAARAVARLQIGFDTIICSPKRRAHQSAALIAEAIRYPYSDIIESESVLPAADPEALLNKLEQLIGERVLVVGHLPHLARTAAALLGCDREIIAFENGGLVCIERQDAGAMVRTVLTVPQLQAIGR